MPLGLSWNQNDFYFNFSITRRFAWLEQRPDIRTRITCRLTKLIEHNAAVLSSSTQADFISSELRARRIGITDVDRAFSSEDLVIYGDVHKMWLFFWRQLDWDHPLEIHHTFVAAFMSELIEDARHVLLMPAVDLRAHLGGQGDLDWVKHIPVEVQAAINVARYQQEKGDRSSLMTAKQELHLAMPSAAKYLPADRLRNIIIDVSTLLGFPTPESTDEEERTQAFQMQHIGSKDEEAQVVEPTLDELRAFQEVLDPHRRLDQQHPDAPGLDMSGVSVRPPTPQAKEGSPSSPLGDIRQKILLQDRLLTINRYFNFPDAFFESYTTDELLDLIRIIEDRAWPSDPQAARTIILNFVLRFGMPILKMAGMDDATLRRLFYKSLYSQHPT